MKREWEKKKKKNAKFWSVRRRAVRRREGSPAEGGHPAELGAGSVGQNRPANLPQCGETTKTQLGSILSESLGHDGHDGQLGNTSKAHRNKGLMTHQRPHAGLPDVVEERFRTKIQLIVSWAHNPKLWVILPNWTFLCVGQLPQCSCT